VTPEPARVLRELRKTARSEPYVVLDEVDPAEARQLLEDGLAATDVTWEPEVSDELRQFRALALARCRAMPEPDRPARPAPEIDDAQRDAIVAEFLASAHASQLPEEAARYGARLMVDFGADYDAGKPLRVSPAKIAGFLLDWVPAKIILDDADRDALPGVVTAWVHWAGEQTGLKQAAVAQLLDVARDCGEDFREAYDQGEDASPIRQFLQGLDTHGDLADAQDALDRRMFATPYFGARIGEEDYPRLNPGDPDERRLLIEGEHPEYHAALADPAFDGEIDGVNPRRHIAIHEVVANQLWEDDPAGAWRAAKRLHDAGVGRHDILHQLGSVVADHARHQAADLAAAPPARFNHPGAAAPDHPGGVRLGGRPLGTRSRLTVAATPDPTSSSGTKPPTRAGPGCATSPPGPAPGCATPTTSATSGSMTCSSKRSCRPTGCRRPSASLAGEPARPRTAAACGAMPSSATSLPTRTILITPNESTGSAAHSTRPPRLAHLVLPVRR